MFSLLLFRRNVLCLSLLFGFLLYLVNLSSQSFPCPSPPTTANTLAVDLPTAYKFHHNYETDWYYLTGSLCIVNNLVDIAFGALSLNSCENPLGFQFTTIFLNQTSSFTTNSEFALSSSIHGRYDVHSFGVGVYNPLTTYDLTFIGGSIPGVSQALELNYDLLTGVAGKQGSTYHFSAESLNATLSLYAVALSDTMYHGYGGYVGNPTSPLCSASYYVSMPRLLTFGTLIYNGELSYVNGLSWFDHQWGGELTNPAQPIGSGWIWGGFHVNDISIMIYIPRWGGVNLYGLYSWFEVQYPDGTTEHGKVINAVFLTNWTSPLTHITYPISQRIYSNLNTVTELYIVPYPSTKLLNQESLLVTSYYWEGDVQLQIKQRYLYPPTGTIPTDNGYRISSSGQGYLELVGFVPS